MTIQSMTGFARAAGEAGGFKAAWEIRSVNGKSLDLKLRLPQGLDAIEAAVRQAVGQRFSRGNVQAGLTLERPDRALAGTAINIPLLHELARAAQRLVDEFGAAPARADGLLALRGVLDSSEAAASPEGEPEARDRLVFGLLGDALDQLAAMRDAEGEALAAILSRHLDAIDRLVDLVETDPSREPAAIRERLVRQMQAILGAHPGLDEARLTAEAALLASRADIREEIDRLRTHGLAARELLVRGGPIGRRLDFLSQEFNREANTLCSKSNAGSITAAGLELKAIIDQFREQVQNLE